MTDTAKHNHQVVFGRRVNGCPRCAQLDNGAAPVQWRTSARQDDNARCADIRDHFTSAAHRDHCGTSCTYGDA